MSDIRRSADGRAKAEAEVAEKKRLADALRANLKRRKLVGADRAAEPKAILPVGVEPGSE